MNTNYNAINTLVLVEEPLQAETIATHLRSADVAISQCWVSNVNEFTAALQREHYGLAVIFIPHAGFDIPPAILRYPDTPFLAIMPKYKNRLSEELMAQGVSEVVGFSHPVRFERVLKRLVNEVKLRSENRTLHNKQRSHASMLDALLQSTQEAVAYVHQGMHSYGNSAYLLLTGHENHNDILQTPLLDVIDPDDHPRITASLRKMERDQYSEVAVEVRMIHALGHTLPVSLHFTHSSYEEESVLQMIVSIHSDEISSNLTKSHKRLPLIENELMSTRSDTAGYQFAPRSSSELEDDQTQKIETFLNTMEISAIEDIRRMIGDTGEEGEKEQWQDEIKSTVDRQNDVEFHDYTAFVDLMPIDNLLLDAGIEIAIEPVISLKADGIDRHQLSLKNSDNDQIHISRRLRKIDQTVGFEQLDIWSLASSIEWLTHNPTSQIFVHLMSDIQHREMLINEATHMRSGQRIPAKAITLVSDTGKSSASTADRINFIFEMHKAGIGVCLSGLSSAKNEFRFFSKTSLDYLVLNHKCTPNRPDTSLSIETQMAICRQAGITTVAAIEGPEEITNIWKLGFDCFLTQPQQT